MKEKNYFEKAEKIGEIMKQLGHNQTMSIDLLSNLQTGYEIIKNLTQESKITFF